MLERITVTSPNDGVNTVRVNLSGTDLAAIIARPPLNVDGVAKNPLWIGNIYAWGSDKAGVGHNPKSTAGYQDRVLSHRRFALPGACWADLEYSAPKGTSFTLDLF